MFKASNLPDLLHKRFSGLGSVYEAEHVFLQCIATLRLCSLQPYLDLDIDLEVLWAQSILTTLLCFGSYEVIASFRHKLLKQKR